MISVMDIDMLIEADIAPCRFSMLKTREIITEGYACCFANLPASDRRRCELHACVPAIHFDQYVDLVSVRGGVTFFPWFEGGNFVIHVHSLQSGFNFSRALSKTMCPQFSFAGQKKVSTDVQACTILGIGIEKTKLVTLMAWRTDGKASAEGS